VDFIILLNLALKLLILSLSGPAQRSADTSSDHKRTAGIPLCGIPSPRPCPVRERSNRSRKRLLASLRHRNCHCFFDCSPVAHGTAKAAPIPVNEYRRRCGIMRQILKPLSLLFKKWQQGSIRTEVRIMLSLIFLYLLQYDYSWTILNLTLINFPYHYLNHNVNHFRS
jgi:hypothetical protein